MVLDEHPYPTRTACFDGLELHYKAVCQHISGCIHLASYIKTSTKRCPGHRKLAAHYALPVDGVGCNRGFSDKHEVDDGSS